MKCILLSNFIPIILHLHSVLHAVVLFLSGLLLAQYNAFSHRTPSPSVYSLCGSAVNNLLQSLSVLHTLSILHYVANLLSKNCILNVLHFVRVVPAVVSDLYSQSAFSHCTSFYEPTSVIVLHVQCTAFSQSTIFCGPTVVSILHPQCKLHSHNVLHSLVQLLSVYCGPAVVIVHYSLSLLHFLSVPHYVVRQ